jgi:hypothetical protein
MYDPVVGRFLGVDPVIQAPEFSQSYNGYSYCLNNPLKYTDPSGYLLSASGDRAISESYLRRHGYSQVDIWWMESFTDLGYVFGESGGFACGGEYHYDWENGVYKNGRGITVTWDEVYYNYIVPFSYSIKDPEQFIKYFQRAYYSALFGISDYNAILTAGPGGGDNRFISTVARVFIPDRISVSLAGNVAVIAGYGQNIEFNWILRGKDARLLPYVTNTLSRRWGVEGDASIQLNLYWFPGPANEISKDFMYGSTKDIDGGFIYGGSLLLGQGENGEILWFGAGAGLGFTLGASYGTGYTSPGLNHPVF